MTEINLTKYERTQLDEAIYKIFPEIEDYEAGILDRVVAELIADRLNEQSSEQDIGELSRLLKIEHHHKQAVYSFMAARLNPDLVCCSPRCPDTNWGGNDRLHRRGELCPDFEDAEFTPLLVRAGVL